MLKDLKLYCKYIKMHILSGLEYKGWWMMCVQTIFIVITDPIAAVLMFSRFGGVGVWTMEHILLIYSLAVTSFGLAESFCRGFDYFPWKMIQSGDFDRLLLRPRSLFIQVAGSYFHIHRLPRVLTGMCYYLGGIPPSYTVRHLKSHYTAIGFDWRFFNLYGCICDDVRHCFFYGKGA